MIDLTVNADPAPFAQRLRGFEDQIPYAVSRAANALAVEVQLAEQHEMRDIFDRPTPFVLNSIKVRRSTKRDMRAQVYINNAGTVSAEKILRAEIDGGERRLKRFEKLLRSRGILPSGFFAVTGEGADLDAFGNIRGSQITQILAYFRAFEDDLVAGKSKGFRANISDAKIAKLKRGTRKKPIGFSYFVGRPGDGKYPFGVWKRFHSKLGKVTTVKPILLFVDSAHYEPIFDFNFVARQLLRRRTSPVLDREIALAIATARIR